MSTDKAKTEGKGSFAAVLASIRPGTDAELADTLRKLIEEVKATGKGGKLTVVFDVKPLDGSGAAVLVNDRITPKYPERNREGSIAYITKDNDLTRRDPSAMPLFEDEDVRDAPNADPHTGEIKDINRA